MSNLSFKTKVGYLPYRMGLALLKSIVSEKLWPRNSFILGTLVPGMSDLDYTIWREQKMTTKERKKLLSRLHCLSKLVPFLGECNLYVAEDQDKIEQCMNLFELSRDPKLAERIKLKAKVTPEAQASAFLLRMIEGDIHNIIARPEARKQKWNHHYQLVTKDIHRPISPLWQDFPTRSLLRALTEVAVQVACLENAAEEHLVIDKVEHYFECLGRKVPLHTLEKDELLWCFFPQRYCFLEKDQFQFSPKQLELFKAQVLWEYWGILAQYQLLEDQKSLLRHLEALGGLVERVFNGATQDPAHAEFLSLKNTMLALN